MVDRAKISNDVADVFPIKKHRKIMLLEDCHEDREIYRRYLQSDAEYQYSFLEAQTGENALEIYSREPVDTVLLDYLLPDMDGLEWLTQWQQQNKTNYCPIIVLTGQGDENVAVKFLQLGAADYLVKNQLTPEKLQISIHRALAEVKLRNQFRNTFEQAAIGIAHVTPNGSWLRVNQKLCQILGYSKEELLEKTFQEITYAEDLEDDLKVLRQMLAGAISIHSREKRYIRKNGTPIWINLTVSLVRDNHGQPDYFISVIEDISDRKELQLSLQKSLRRLKNLHQIDRAILEAEQPQTIAKTALICLQKLITCQRTSIVTFDRERQKATILATGGQAEQLARDGCQISLSVWQNLIEQLESCSQKYLVCFLSQFPLLSQTIPAFEQAGLDCFISFPLKADGNLLGIFKLWIEQIETITSEELAIVSEISNQIAIAIWQAHLYEKTQNHASELESKVAQRTAQLEEINQELKAFSYSISHDLKAPLRAIQGFATALQEDYAENFDDLGREYTKRLVNSAQHMERLIQDLLAYSRLSQTEIQLQLIDLGWIVSRVIAELNLEITQAIAQVKVEQPLLEMWGNRTILVQVVSNLVSNAIKFVAPNVQPEVRIWTETKNDRVRLWIADNGIGIEPQHQERIFRVFERLHGNEAYPGTGIGLAIVKKGMERLGGRVGIESNSEQGSYFWIEANRGFTER